MESTVNNQLQTYQLKKEKHSNPWQQFDIQWRYSIASFLRCRTKILVKICDKLRTSKESHTRESVLQWASKKQSSFGMRLIQNHPFWIHSLICQPSMHSPTRYNTWDTPVLIKSCECKTLQSAQMMTPQCTHLWNKFQEATIRTILVDGM